jgi:type IV pilus biogenesis protein CpaD/CtpE
MTGYEVTDLADTLTKAKTSGVEVLVPRYKTDEREAVVVQFPGGYIAEIHSVTKK